MNLTNRLHMEPEFAKGIELHGFIMQLVDQWNRDRNLGSKMKIYGR